MTRRQIWLAVLAAGLLSSTGLTRGADQAAPADPPRFRVAVDVVRLDAVVTDKDGKLVTDLTADDFDVHQDGRPQKISLVRWVPIAGPQSASTSQTPSAASPSGAAPDRLAPGG